MKKIFKALIIIVLVIPFYSCEKYDETPNEENQELLVPDYNINVPEELTRAERDILRQRELEYNNAVN